MAMILSATMLLKHVGELDAAARIERALTSVLERRDRVTGDLGGGADGGTRAMTQAIIEAMEEGGEGVRSVHNSRPRILTVPRRQA